MGLLDSLVGFPPTTFQVEAGDASNYTSARYFYDNNIRSIGPPREI